LVFRSCQPLVASLHLIYAAGIVEQAKGRRMTDGIAPRAAAVAVLDAVLGEGRTLAQVDDLLQPLPPQDRARALRLATSVLRVMEGADAVLIPHLRKVPPLTVVNALRLAVVEIGAGAAAHGVVNAAVEVVRRGKRTGHMTGLVNAVLRKVPGGVPAGPVQKLPRWLRQPMVHAYGRDAVAAIETVHAGVPPLDLTLKPGAAGPEGEALPNGTRRLAQFGQVTALPGYAEGQWWAQDAAAAMAVPLLAPVAGEQVLDLCAAPGGKTLQLAAAGAQVTAVDMSGPRMARVAENLARTGLSASLVVADALHWAPDGAFDAILLDAPCSATGTIRRHPDLPFVKDGSDVPGLVALQTALLDRALGWLKPGGRLVFCTCSLLPDEGEGHLAGVLSRHAGLRADRPHMPWVDPDWITPDGGLRLRPDYWGGMDGFFMARLTKG
jgi:16S rRNA (cytosine967-C5)-methyltransferase